MFQACYSFLYYFVYNGNIHNKQYLEGDLGFIIRNLDLVDVGQCQLVVELFKENPSLIKSQMNEKLIRKILNQIIKY